MSEKTVNTGTSRWSGDIGSLQVVVLALAAFLVFSGTLGHQLVWDDEPVIRYARTAVEDGGVASLALVPFSTGLEGSGELSGYYRPVSLVSMWINSPTGVPSPIAYHLGNILLHVINCLLVFQLFRLILPPGGGAWIGSMIFAVHPVHSESVAFVSGRTDLLAALFTLLVVILWYRSCNSQDIPSRDHFALGMFFFALACLSKEIAFVLPAGTLLWFVAERPWDSRLPGTEVLRRGKWVLGLFLVLGALLFVRFFFLGIGAGPGWSRYARLSGASLISLLGDITVNLMQYVRLMVFPWPLAVFYPPVPPRLTWLTWVAVLAFIAMCLAFSGRRHHHLGLFSLGWTLLFLFPVSGILGLGQSVIAERFCYLPSIGVAAILGYSLALPRSRGAYKVLHSILVVVVLSTLGAGAAIHSGRWKDDLTLFTNALITSSVKVPTLYVSLGVALRDDGDDQEALEAFEEAVRLDPSYLKAWLNLGVTRLEINEPVQALDALERAGVLAPGNPSVWYNKGLVLEALGRTDEALDAYARTVMLDPGEPAADYRKGKLLARLGRYEESLAAYAAAVSIDKSHAGAYIGMGRSYEKMGRQDKAVELFMKAIEVQPDQVIAYGDLGRILLATGKTQEATEVFRMATAIDPLDPVAGKGLVIAYLNAGDEEKARAYIQSLGAADPDLQSRLSALMDSIAGQGDK